MRADVARDLSDSAYDFKNTVWPVVGEWCGGGDLVPVESISNVGFVKDLDVLAGIDAWHIHPGRGGIRGIASRIQYGRPWASFTIRKKRTSGAATEYEKRLNAIHNSDDGWLLPGITIQAYLDSRRGGSLKYACIVNTKDLFIFIENGLSPDDFEIKHNPQDGNEFIIVWAKTLKENGVRVREYTAQGVYPVQPKTTPIRISA